MADRDSELEGLKPIRGPSSPGRASSEAALPAATRGPTRPVSSSSSSTSPGQRRGDPAEERALVLAKLNDFVAKSYFEILRLTPAATAAQVDRAFKYLSGALGSSSDPGSTALADLLSEAHAALLDPVRGAEYRSLAAKKDNAKALKRRRELEADPKLERVTLAIAARKLGEASVLIEWAGKLHPERPDLAAHRVVLEFHLSNDQTTADKAMGEVKRARSKRDTSELRLYHAWFAARARDRATAESLLADEDGTHPLYREAMDLLTRS